MNKLVLSGVIRYEYPDSFEKIKLIQEDGYKIDLVGRFQELQESHPPLKMQVNYFISEKDATIEIAKEAWLKQIVGAVVAEYDKQDWQYSSWTSGTDYNSTLTIGGHSLFNELRQYNNKFIILEINLKLS